MGWLKTTPIVSLLLAVAFAAAPLAIDPARSWGERYDQAVAEAREILIRNPKLAVDTDGERVLDPEWMTELRRSAEESGSGAEVELPERMVARSQAQLDALLAQAYEARRLAAPAWRLGVLDGETPIRNAWAHAFVHENLAGLILMLAVLLVVATPLERSWGPLLFGAFVLLSIPLSAQGYRLLDASGVPWSGSSGLAAALVGAYFIRGLGGHFLVPSFVVLPVWLGVEAFVVRGFWLDDLTAVPWATLCGGFGLGAAGAALIRLFGVEAKLDAHTASRAKNGPNPVVVRAARLRSDGDPQQAFELMQAAWREHRGDEEIADAFYSIAAELGRPEAAAEAILPVLRGALKKGQVERALGYWLPLATRRCEVRLEPTAAVRLGEALLDAGHPDEALFSLRSALDAGASTAHAIRILNIARDLDPGLTRRAAGIALADPALDAATRARLMPLAALADEDASAASSGPRTALPAPHASPRPGTGKPVASLLADPEPGLAALSEESLAAETAAIAEADELAEDASADLVSQWNDRSILSESALSGEDPDALGADGAADFDGASLIETREALFGDDDIDFLGPDGETTDSDRTPLLDASAEQMGPFGEPAGEPADGETAATIMMSPAPPAADHRAHALLRALLTIEAVPLEARGDAIEIDTDGRGKSRLPIARIEAIGMAVVRGLGPRPIVVVDCILNWRDDIGSPLKLIRFRSDRFDPAAVGLAGAGANPASVLGRWVAELQRASGAACLPSDAILAGSPATFDTLEDYEREVLGAERALAG